MRDLRRLVAYANELALITTTYAIIDLPIRLLYLNCYAR